MISRRQFLTGLALTAAAAATPALALAAIPFPSDDMGSNQNGDPLPDYDERSLQGRPEQQPLYVDGMLKLRRGHTGERYGFNFRDVQGNYNPEIMLSLDWFMRCNYDDSYLRMDTRIIEELNYIAKWFGNPEITINSAYRTPRYNQLISKNNENVAKNSLHIVGRAIDFSIPGIPIRQVCQVAQATRNLAGTGGVGYYPSQNFVHIDCGTRSATWVR